MQAKLLVMVTIGNLRWQSDCVCNHLLSRQNKGLDWFAKMKGNIDIFFTCFRQRFSKGADFMAERSPSTPSITLMVGQTFMLQLWGWAMRLLQEVWGQRLYTLMLKEKINRLSINYFDLYSTHSIFLQSYAQQSHTQNEYIIGCKKKRCE